MQTTLNHQEVDADRQAAESASKGDSSSDYSSLDVGLELSDVLQTLADHLRTVYDAFSDDQEPITDSEISALMGGWILDRCFYSAQEAETLCSRVARLRQATGGPLRH